MTPGTENFLIELIPQGGFAAFLLYLYISIKKEMEKFRLDAKAEEIEIRKENKSEIVEMRSRYDSVISTLNSEKDNYRVALHEEIGKLAGRVGELEKTAAAIVIRLDAFSENIQDLKARI